jgi:branched-chain amino acid aminotransferase
MCPGLNYGQQAFEGIKAFRTADNRIAIFRPRQNAARMQHSAEVAAIPPVPDAHFLRCCKLAVGLNAAYVPPHATGAALYIRPLAFGSSAQLGLNPPQEYTFCVFVVPTGVYHGIHPLDALIMEEFDRAAPHGTGSAKLGGNYAPVMRWSEKARADGFGITLHLDSQTRTEIDEFSTAGFVGIKRPADGRTVMVVPDSRAVIKSVTSDSACELARSFGWTLERRPIKTEELPDFSEVMAAGTAAALVPVKSITFRSAGVVHRYLGQDGKPGPANVRLLTALKGIQQGKVADPFGWLEYVEAPTDFIQANGKLANGTQANGVAGDMDRLP